ncbi:MAG TPA: hypothetical protein VG410_08715 [Solirubrobacteraceae bacterium]|nr:hypothetical protein [Solirubrobacteraceae bacterium]
MEFLVEFDVHVPDGTEVNEVEVRYGAEASASCGAPVRAPSVAISMVRSAREEPA